MNRICPQNDYGGSQSQGFICQGLLASQSGPRQQDVKLIDLGLPSADLVG